MSNFGDLKPIFSATGRTSNNTDPIFNSRPSSSGLSKTRFSKVRKQVKPQNLMKPSLTSDSLPGQGFNPFHYRGSPRDPLPGETGFGRNINEGFVFVGSSAKLSSADEIGNRVMEELGKLKIEGENVYKKNSSSDGHLASRLHGDMQNLNIKDSHSSSNLSDNARRDVNDELKLDASKDSFGSSSSWST